ncbi:MAG: family 1 extracellular solute-binding protein [Paenibacillus sp.]|jgi:multiple sugar transport system substrate-binding protein|nr:family 1 extracellular solute-binding protein [Paenibacillus sp.]
MNVTIRGTAAWFALVFVILVAAGCLGGKSDGGTFSQKEGTNTVQPEKPPEPVTVKFAASSSHISDEEFEKYVKIPVSRKYPYIAVQRVDFSQKGTTLAELVAAKEIPDIYGNGPLDLTLYMELGLDFSMDEIIKLNQFDLNRIRPEILDTVRTTTSRKDLIGLPLYNQGWALFYNKDLFDKMAVPYPKDGMSWEQARDTAVKFRKDEGGVSYYGLYPDNVFRGAYQMSLPWVDPQTNKGMLQSAGWKELFDLWSSLYTVPGHTPKGSDNNGLFSKGNLAMLTGSATRARAFRTIQGLNWDIVTYPENKKAPGFGQRVDPYFLLITNASKQKDAAFKVISVMLSDEVQLEMSRNTWMSVLTKQSIHNEFAKNYPEFQSKNMIAFTKPKLAGIQSFGGVAAYTFANNALDDVVYNGKDINTALREADEKLNKALEESKQKSN